MKKIAAALAKVRKMFWWQLTVSEVSFIGEEGVSTVYHIHPAWWSKNMVFEDALYQYLPNHIPSGDAQ